MNLTNLLENSIVLTVKEDFRGYFVSDVHLGRGRLDKADDFYKVSKYFLDGLKKAYDSGYHLFIVGDWIDAWENANVEEVYAAYPEIMSLVARFKAEGRGTLLAGNHDFELGCPQAIVLENADTKARILLCHGHQIDWINFEGWPITKFFVRYIWRTLQYFGVPDPTSARKEVNPNRHEAVREKLIAWANAKPNVGLICGHTHVREQVGNYTNCGSWVSGRPEIPVRMHGWNILF